MKQGLIIFVRNPILGKVKTRLASTLGPQKALNIYRLLLAHTYTITKPLPCDKFVFYSDFIDENDGWENDVFNKKIQSGNDLGERMLYAFSTLFDDGYQQLIIIGSDCLEIDTALLLTAFKILHDKETVIGPSLDGGYYLLGMCRPINELFVNKQWGSDTVLSNTIHNLVSKNINYELLTQLNDIDEATDLPPEFFTG